MNVGFSSNRKPGESRLPVCEQLVPRLEENGQHWLVELARWYESNWHLALEGAAKPSADSVLQLITPDRQEQVRTVLETIDTRYTTLLSEKESGVSNAEPDPTINLQLPASTGDSANVATRSLGNVPNSAAADGRSQTVRLEATLDGSDELVDGNTVTGDGTTDRPVVRTGRSSDQIARQQSSLPDIPGYKIQKVLGRGGMGIVYLAQQEGIDRSVALKMILPRGEINQVALDRFYAEARAVGRFQHENIVRIYDAGTHQGMPYFSLEYVDGASLADQQKGQPMDPVAAARLMEPMARAMQVAHHDGVIHRDLKPANVLMTRDGVPKITDFGLAKELEADEQLSQDGSVIGTPAFMSPEQARGSRDVGPLTDVYGFGALFYCLLTGRPPFQGAKATDTLMQVIHNDPVEPIKLQPAIPKDLETICLKCLQKDPSQRYANAESFADDLGRFIRGEPIQARPVSRTERVWRWCQRNPVVAAASGIAAVLALVVMIGGPVSTAVIYQQKQDVIEAKDEAEQNAQLADRRALEANDARLLADQNAEAAAVQEKNAIDVLKRMTYNVQSRMKGQTNLVGLRKELIQIVQNGLQQMEKYANNAREQNMIAAGIHVRLGDINLEIGRAEQAFQAYHQCFQVFETLDKKGELPFPEQNWSKIYLLLGEAARNSGDLATAKDSYQKSLDLRRSLASASPSLPSLNRLAESLTKVGSLAQVLGELDRGRQAMEEAVAVRQRIFKAERNANNFNELLGAQVVLAKVVFQQGQTDEGIKLIGQAAEQMADHAAKNRQSDGAQYNSAMFDREMAVMQLYVGQTKAAEATFHRSVDVLEALLAGDPYNSQIQEDLEDALYGLLVARRELGTLENASIEQRLLELRRQSVDQDPESIGKQTRLLNALARCGRLVEANRLAGELDEKINPDDPLQYVLACAYAQLAGARNEVDGAADEDGNDIPSAAEFRQASLTALRHAIDAGFDRPTDLKLDPDLDPVRETDEFNRLFIP